MEPDKDYWSYSSHLQSLFAMAGLEFDELKRRVLNPDLRRFPGFARAEGTLITLEPGDVFYLPNGYWHGGLHDGLTVGVNFWWGSPVVFDQAWQNAYRWTPADNDRLQQPGKPLPKAFRQLKFPRARKKINNGATGNNGAPSRKQVKRAAYISENIDDEERILDYAWVEAERRKAGCFRPQVGDFGTFKTRMATIKEADTSCIQNWFGRFWDKLGKLTEVAKNMTRDRYLRRNEKTSASLQRACGMSYVIRIKMSSTGVGDGTR